MDLVVRERVVEAPSPDRFLIDAADVTRVIEACLSSGARAAVLYAENLPSAFFDLSSGQAGTILQKLRNYGIRLAVVSSQNPAKLSARFTEMAAEERKRGYFAIFETIDGAREWLQAR